MVPGARRMVPQTMAMIAAVLVVGVVAATAYPLRVAAVPSRRSGSRNQRKQNNRQSQCSKESHIFTSLLH